MAIGAPRPYRRHDDHGSFCSGFRLSFQLRGRASLELELIVLRHQVAVLRRLRPGRPKLFRADRLLWVWLHRIWPQALNAMAWIGLGTCPQIGVRLTPFEKGRAELIPPVPQPCAGLQ